MFIKLRIQGFFWSLVTNLLSVCTNSRGRNQFGGQKFRKLFNFYESQYTGIFWVADYESVISFYKSKMAVKNFENCLSTIPLYTLFGKHSSTIFLNKKNKKNIEISKKFSALSRHIGCCHLEFDKIYTWILKVSFHGRKKFTNYKNPTTVSV